MQLFEEYGTKLLASPDSDGNPNSSLVTNLTYTLTLILLVISEEDDTQIEQLVQLMEQGNTAFHVLSIVLTEAYRDLHKVYNFDKETILRIFENFIEADGVELDEDGLAQHVLARFRSVNIDFSKTII